VLFGVIAVLVVGGGAFALGMLAFSSDHSAAPAKQVRPHGTGSRSGDQSATHSPAAVARSISVLMADSRLDKSEIGRASSDLGACRNVPAGIQAFEDAAASRHRLMKEAGKLRASTLRGGRALVDELDRAWSISAQADAAYARWGRSVHRVHGKCVGGGAALNRATELSDRSHPYKQAAARSWKKIARRYGLPAVAWDQL
jgi:hypothetical protein